MLGKTAGGLYWMFRLLERAENNARLLEAGFRIALTRSTAAESEWKSVITTSAARQAFEARHSSYASANVVDFLLRDPGNPSSVLSCMRQARDNARLVRTALTTEVWVAVNETWMLLKELLSEEIVEADLPDVLGTIRQQSALVRGALHGTMLRNDMYNFCRLGTFVERMDNTARIIDVKYYTLLPAPSFVGSKLDNVQWETILRSVSAHRSFRWAMDGDYSARSIAEYLILDGRMPRSLVFCGRQIVENLQLLDEGRGETLPSLDAASAILARLQNRDIGAIFDEGLHEFTISIINATASLGRQIEQDYRFNN